MSEKKRRGSIGAREAALMALGEYRRNGAFPLAHLNRLIDRHGLSAPDGALAARITGGVLQNMMLCDFYAAHFSALPLKKLEPAVLDILRLSLYQIAFLTRVPASAAVNEGVELAGRYANPKAAGFVNAVLRSAARAFSCGGLPQVPAEPLRNLSIRFSHPEWLVREFCEMLGEDGAEALLTANNSPDVPLCAQVNTLRADAGTALAALEASCVRAAPHAWLENSIEFRGAGSIKALPAFREGFFYIQDAASRLAVMAADPKPGDLVVDGCASPGGKSFASAISMNDEGRVISFDLGRKKTNAIKDGAARLGLNTVEASERDAMDICGELKGRADITLADVPCSGFGAIRRKPEIRYKSEDSAAGLPELQLKILTSLSAYVKEGGALLYSTCTVLRRENEEVAEEFLRSNSGFETEGFELPGVGAAPDGRLTLWPHIHGTDGFFICKMRRVR